MALFVIGVVVTLVLAVGAGIALLLTSGAKAVSDNAPLIAAVIALGGVGTAQMVSIALEDQRTRETRALEDQRTRETRALEDQRTQEARNLEAQRAREAALQNYFENVGELLIEKPLLLKASPGDNLSTVVRAHTLSVLEGLDPERKRILLLFLYESGLIYERKQVVSLTSANLRRADLRGGNLGRANLSEANLFKADLSEAYLGGADLSEADLRRADLSEADLSEAKLTKAYLGGTYLVDANLRRADLRGGNLGRANLFEADLSEAKLRGAYLRRAYLSEADLGGADLRGANLFEADLSNAKLRGADLSGADLSIADLTNARGINNKDLEQQAASLEGATMPNGQKYEDWLKDNEGHK